MHIYMYIHIYMHTYIYTYIQGAGARLLDPEEDDDSTIIARYDPTGVASLDEVRLCTHVF